MLRKNRNVEIKKKLGRYTSTNNHLKIKLLACPGLSLFLLSFLIYLITIVSKNAAHLCLNHLHLLAGKLGSRRAVIFFFFPCVLLYTRAKNCPMCSASKCVWGDIGRFLVEKWCTIECLFQQNILIAGLGKIGDADE